MCGWLGRWLLLDNWGGEMTSGPRGEMRLGEWWDEDVVDLPEAIEEEANSGNEG